MKKKLAIVLAALAGVALLLQFFQPGQINPPTEPALHFALAGKPPENVQAILRRSCNDCHSNETVWPWYSRIAPGSWLITHDVVEGRRRLNFSTWGRLDPQVAEHRWNDVCDQAQAGKMPPRPYLWLHPASRLSPADVDALCSF